MILENAEILIIGGGVAGLSTAYHLARAGRKGVVVVDREAVPGFYASGHNAGIARQLTGRAEHTALTLEGRGRLAEAGLLTPTGGYLLGADPGGVEALAREAEAFALPVARGEGAPFPGLQAREHLHIPSDGLIDTAALLEHCADGARAGGARVRYGCQVEGIRAEDGGFRVTTDQGELRARVLVNAAGGWAGDIGRMAGGLPIAFTPLRRHLVWSTAAVAPDRPYTWWADRPLYLRPESGGLLLCACEEQAVAPPPRGVQPANDATMLEGLAATLQELVPALGDAPVTRLWCGIRTFAPDRRFVLGPDPVQPNLFWVAGLGGHGMTSGLAVGAAAARGILEKESAGSLDPRRLFPH
ncbi:NAD(P)/FAD-dependent oxidoreductase [Mesoterricola silvestris]|uniref:Glycerol-3-phosphate dehydrogenase n=1 Tax=Mesoterricola silvestris TaxID=2927979 RepID=A0AA48H9D2_9BACT|nr:FAD-dependent oxidoreductase [Mesoterricola silvestris]BDU74178.1 glycerol-3-phosphate dehydrogenase [Mesoterricola silvestris]